MLQFGGYLLRFHLASDWPRNNKHSRHFLWCSRFYGKDCKPTRGVKQGCPLSPYLFILGAEILSNKICQSKLVKGINIYENEVKVSQFADDTNLFCGDITSVDNALCLVNNFAPGGAGLKLNVKKTKALWMGKWRNNRTTLLQLSWPRDPVKILGIFFSYDDKANDHYNFNLKIQIHLDIWSSRSLTLFGKVFSNY